MLESDYLKDNLKFLQKLREIPTLDAFSETDLRRFLELSKVRKYQPGEVILAEGFFDCWVYFLVSGKVHIIKNGETLSTLRRTGDVFGEMGVIDGAPRSASVYAVTETVCLATDASYIDRLSGNDRVAFCYVLYRVFCEILASRLRLTSDELIKVKEENKRLKSANILCGTSRR
jgi:CRP/FNR family transcriptional regulator, cyclic AMP receptor protein